MFSKGNPNMAKQVPTLLYTTVNSGHYTKNDFLKALKVNKIKIF